MTGNVMNRIGIVVLILIFGWSAWTVLSRNSTLLGGDQEIVVRIGHWQLESGLRDAFDALAKRYSEMHPGVTIKQEAVPGRVYQTWMRTGLAGGQEPDLMVTGQARDEVLARHFLPLTRELAEPNPYNKGTDLEGVPWRETFVDGLSNSLGVQTLQEYYSVPMAVLTIRLYVNSGLWKKFLGERPLPRDFDDLISACEDITRKSRELGQDVTPIASSRFTAEMLFSPLFKSQTQKFTVQLNRLDNLTPPRSAVASAFLPGMASLDDPAIRDGLQIVREISQFMQPGFLQLEREDAILAFAQQRAVMLPTGAWDFLSIKSQSPFPIEIVRIPWPSASHPRYGKNILGPPSEAGSGSATSFCLSAASRHPEVALDFLRFMTSQPGNEIFAQTSKWLPSVAGAKPSETTKEFMPEIEGATDGFAIAPIMFGGGEITRIYAQNIHHLVDPDGSVEAFVEALRPSFAKAVQRDVQRQIDDQTVAVRRLEGPIAARRILPEDGTRRLSAAVQSQNAQEAFSAWLNSQNASIKP
jgi:raffinose/stachyose/melibiose transport system substrate-binding protein